VIKPFIAVIMSSLFLVGCQSSPYSTGPLQGEQEWAPTVVEQSDIERNPGSLYANNQRISLFKDRRAYRTGDILTVILDEETRSSKNADTSMGKQSDINIEAPTFGGTAFDQLAATVNAGRNFAGESTASQENSLSGNITVTVADVKANGVLVIKGEKWLKLNQGDEYIRLRGLVRVEDITEGNQISSQRIANAQITYSGRGSLAEANEPGWFSRILNSPFFPF